MAPNTSFVAGAGENGGCGAPAELGGDSIGGLVDSGVLALKIPPCRRQICVGSVPERNGSAATRGHEGVARPPVVGSMVAMVMPGGGGPKPICGWRTALRMNATHAGNAASAPGSPISCGSSNPTHTPQTNWWV